MFKVVHPTHAMDYLHEAGQSLDVKFSFAQIDREKQTVERLHEWVKCRDFLGDVVYAMIKKASKQIYGFRADPDLFKRAEESTQLLVKFPTKVARDAFLANYKHIVHEVEKTNKIVKSKVTSTDDDYVLCVEGHKFWQRTVWLISLYSYLLKCSCYPYKNVVEWRKEVVEKGVTESTYMMKVQKNWDKVTTNLKKVVGKDKCPVGKDTTDISTVHNYSGFVALLTNPQLHPTNVYCQRIIELLK